VTSALPEIGVVGLGAMGSRIAVRLMEGGYSVTGYDPRSEAIDLVAAKGARVARSPRDLADIAEIVIASLPTPDAAREAVASSTGVAQGGAVRGFVELSTIGPSMAADLGQILNEAGIWCIDAPVSGAPAGAQAGTLTMMVAGEPEAIESARPVLNRLARAVYVVGEQPGMGQTAKVINNLLSAAAIVLTAEALTLGVKAGLDARTLLDVIGNSSGSNSAVLDKFPRQVVTRRFDHGFRLELMAKDVGLCLAEARRREVPMVLGATVDQLWRLAERHPDSGEDCTTIVRMFEQWAQATIAEGVG
jgi:3-hydroxyisobutyrate dehydrogenase-like beta-hydroxyacid dehydrogenase